MTRKIPIDTLRGLACLLLVAYHVIGGDASRGLPVPADHPMRALNEALALLRMPLFSFLSGFVYAWRPYDGNTAQFVTGKVRRLIVPMLLVGTFFAVLQANTPGTTAGAYDWRLLHIIPVAHFWFLEALFIIFMLTALLERFHLLDSPKGFLAVWLLAALVNVNSQLPVYLSLDGAAYLLPFFLLGLGANRFGDRLPRGAAMVASAVLFGYCVLVMALLARSWPDRGSVVGLLVSASLCIFLLKCQFESRALAWIGAASFAIYLFHTMFSAASRIVLLRLEVDSIPVLFACGLAAGIFGPMVVARMLGMFPPWGPWIIGEPDKRKPAAKQARPTSFFKVE